MKGRKNERMKGWKDERMKGWKDERKNKWMAQELNKYWRKKKIKINEWIYKYWNEILYLLYYKQPRSSEPSMHDKVLYKIKNIIYLIFAKI